MTSKITDGDIAAIKASLDSWIAACLERDWDALLALCTSDIVFMPPDAPIAEGPQATRAYLEAFPVMKTFTAQFAEIDGEGDQASARGSFRIVATVDDQDVTMSGKFVDTLRKANGAWKYRIVIWNTDQPMG